jgi:hypothetical protein
MLLIAAGFAIALATQSASYAATPQKAALAALHSGRPMTVARTNLAGRYATVLIRGAMLEGEPVTAPILLERFSFGWQPIELVNFACRRESHGLSLPDRERLMQGMPSPPPPAADPCAFDISDTGPPAQVEAVRRLMQGPLIPAVTIAGGYALGHWYGAGGGQSLYQRRAGSWHRLTGGGGALGISEMRRFHVPRSAWCTFRVYDAPCKV